jgi:5S rRNA maturation endonuclease (ribonuclease M5)
VLVSEQEILKLKDFVFELNSIKNSVVVVEGKRDSSALKKLGYSGKILEFHRFGGMINFIDSA